MDVRTGIWIVLALLVVVIALLIGMAVRLARGPAPAGQSAPGQSGEDGAARGQIAIWVISLSGIGLLVVSIAVIAVAWAKGGDPEKTTTMVFNALLPLLGTWVGTVIAYYFSSANYEAARRGVPDLVKHLTPAEKLASVPVKQAMMVRQRMKVISLPVAANATANTIAAAAGNVRLQDHVFPLLQGPVTRVPVLAQNNVFLYIIHQSMLYKFIYDRTTQPPAEGAPAFNPAQATLQHFLDHPGMRDLVSKSAAFVPEAASLADAKAAMEKVQDCQDVFVTSSGQADQPVLGWLTNSDIIDNTKV